MMCWIWMLSAAACCVDRVGLRSQLDLASVLGQSLCDTYLSESQFPYLENQKNNTHVGDVRLNVIRKMSRSVLGVSQAFSNSQLALSV